jgi:carboxyl-terminal processing protease
MSFELCNGHIIAAQAIIDGELQGVDGYIIDLRNNPGGVFEDAITISSYFLDNDGHDTHIVETVRNNDPDNRRNIIDNVWTVGLLPSDVFPAHAWGLTSRPMVLLTNQGTASASEVMAGALQVCQQMLANRQP